LNNKDIVANKLFLPDDIIRVALQADNMTFFKKEIEREFDEF
jgi:hypothetical protein